jgi:hypothetical protein
MAQQDPSTTPTTETKKRDYIRVFGPDNKYYRFPTGTTKDQAIGYFKQKGITSPESKVPKTAKIPPSAPGAAALQTDKKQVDMMHEHPFYSGIAQGFGLDPQKVQKYGTPEIARETMTGFSKLMEDVAKDPLAISRAIESFATGLEGGVHEIVHGTGIRAAGPFQWKFEPTDESEILHGLGATISSLGQILGGAEGAERLKGRTTLRDASLKTAHEVAQRVGVDPAEAARGAQEAARHPTWKALSDRKAVSTAYLHNKGIEIANKIQEAAKEADKEVKLHSDAIADQIDTKIPTGVIDAGSEATKIRGAFAEEVKAPEKMHPLLKVMLKDATATAPGLWSWEKTRQLRSSVGRVMNKVAGPQRAVLTQVYVDLTNKLGSTAKRYGLEESWSHYNELERKVSKQFRGLIDDVYANSKGRRKSGRSVAKTLTADMGITSELARNLGKYGLSYKEVMNYVRNSKGIFKDEAGVAKTLWGYAYKYGFPAVLVGRAAGAGFMPSLAAGFALGYTVTQIMKTMRALRLSGDLAEHIMKQRELPSRRTPSKGVFPSEAAPALPEPSAPTPTASPVAPEPKTPPSLPEPKTERRGEAEEKGPRAKLVHPEQRTLYYKLKSELEADDKAPADKKMPQRDRAIKEEQIEDITGHPFGEKKLPYDIKSAKVEKKLTKEEAEAESAKRHAKPSEPTGRWTPDKGSIPGEPREYLDVPGGDIDKAKAGIIEHESAKGTKYEAMTSEGKSLGTFDTMDEAKAAAEAKFTKAAPGEVGREPGKKAGTTKESAIGRRTKARERVEKSRATAKRTRESEAKEAIARAQATQMDVSQLQIPEMEEFLRSKSPTAFKSLQEQRKAKAFPETDYKNALMFYTLEALEGTAGED